MRGANELYQFSQVYSAEQMKMNHSFYKGIRSWSRNNQTIIHISSGLKSNYNSTVVLTRAASTYP